MKQKHAAWPALLNAVLPGLGHAISGHLSVGVLLASFYLGYVALLITSDTAIGDNPELLVPICFVWGTAVYDSWVRSQPGFMPVSPLRVHYLDPHVRARIAGYLRQTAFPKQAVKIYCIGSDEYPGDTFGPLVGTMLRKYGHQNIVGYCAEPLDAQNLDTIARNIGNDPIIAVDAAVAHCPEQEGLIIISPGSLEPGSSLGRSLPNIGSLSIVFAASHTKNAAGPLLLFLDPSIRERSAYAAHIVAQVLDEFLRGVDTSWTTDEARGAFTGHSA